MAILESTRPYTEVYIWLARDWKHRPRTAFIGGIAEKIHGKQREDNENIKRGRVGHVSMEMFPRGDANNPTPPGIYVSLWPLGNKAQLMGSFKTDEKNEGTLPDSIIRLHYLNVPEMIRTFEEELRKRVEDPDREDQQIRWELTVKENADVTIPGNTRASCATFVYNLLKIGGFADPQSVYYNHVSGRGPKNKAFYRLTNCHLGDALRGIFNGAPWTRWVFSPKALLLRVAAAAEAAQLDKAMTSAIMTASIHDNPPITQRPASAQTANPRIEEVPSIPADPNEPSTSETSSSGESRLEEGMEHALSLLK